MHVITLETSHPEMSPSKEVPKNVATMFATLETSHPERSPSKAATSKNMYRMLVTPERSGASVAAYSMPEAPRKAPSIVVHSMSPH